VAQGVKNLLSKHQALSSNPRLTKIKSQCYNQLYENGHSYFCSVEDQTQITVTQHNALPLSYTPGWLSLAFDFRNENRLRT
jgi:hypothetical protein